MKKEILFPIWLAILFGCLIAMASFGSRSMMGLFVYPLAEIHGGRAIVSLGMAFQNLTWGFAQPFMGMIADKFGVGRVFILGAIAYCSALIIIASTENSSFYLLGGVLMGIGIAGTSFSLVMISLGRLVSSEKRAWAMGLGTAAGSFGQLVFAPLSIFLMEYTSWQNALIIVAIGLLAIIPLAYPLRGKPEFDSDEQPMNLGEALRKAFKHRHYQLLVLGFFVCGFHLAFITTHLPPYLIDKGMPPELNGWVLALIGLFNIIGCYGVGYLAKKYHNPYILALNYATRSLVFLIFIIVPVSVPSAIIFACCLGLLWLSTVPPTAMAINKMFGARYMNTLYGFAFVSHQIGSFIGVYAGGLLYDKYKNYDYMWFAAIIIGVLSALIHLPIKTYRAKEFLLTSQMAKS